MRKGDRLEKDFSVSLLKQKYHPVLISPLVLRSKNAGQIDAAGLQRINHQWVLTLFELKYSQFPGRYQYLRLLRSQDYLSKILEMSVKLEVKFCQKDEP